MRRSSIPLRTTLFLLIVGFGAVPASAKTFRLPSPLPITVKIDRALESTEEMAGKDFLVTVTTPLKAEGCLVLPEKAQGQGRVIGSFPPERPGVPGKLQLQLVKLAFADGKSREVSTEPLEVVGEKPESEKVLKILWSRKGKPVQLEPGSELTFKIDADLELTMECLK